MSFIKYDEYDLIELFECIPISLEVEMYWYSKRNQMGVTLGLWFSVYDQKYSLSLMDEEGRTLLDMNLTNVEKLSRSGNKLIIHCVNEEKNVSVWFTSSFYIETEIDMSV